MSQRTMPTLASVLGAVERAVLGLVLAGIPLFFLGRLTNDPFNLPKLALLVTGLGVCTALLIFCPRPPRRVALLAVPAAALVVPLGISWLWSPYRAWALFGQYGRFNGLIPYFLFAVLGILVVHAFWGRSEVLARILAVTGGVVGTYALIQSLGLDVIWSPGTDAGSEYAPSTIGHYNFVGGFLAISLPAALWLWSRPSRRERWLGIWATVGICIGLLMANSQGGWAAALAGSSVMVGALLEGRVATARKIGLGVAAAVAVGLVVTVVASAAFPQALAGGSVGARRDLWHSALEMGADSPFIGRGPAAYAIEGTRHRSLDSVLAEPGAKADEPHSVPLSFWANAGLLGALGFLILTAWILRTGLPIAPGDHRSMVFFAALIAYLVQSLSSIDMLPLRAGLWLAIAGLVISKDSGIKQESEQRVPSPARWGYLRMILALLIASACVWYSAGLVIADRQVHQATGLFVQGAISEARKRFEDASAFRYEPRYLRLYAEGLGTAGLNQGRAGASLIEQMRRVNTYLEEHPETFGMLGTARTLHYWSRFEPRANEEALGWLARARPLDPENPEIDIRTAQVLISLERISEARTLLEAWEPRLTNHLATFWGALSIARWADGDRDASAHALNVGVALSPNECRVVMAQLVHEHHGDVSSTLDEATSFAFTYNCGRGEFEWLKGLLEGG